MRPSTEAETVAIDPDAHPIASAIYQIMTANYYHLLMSPRAALLFLRGVCLLALALLLQALLYFSYLAIAAKALRVLLQPFL